MADDKKFLKKQRKYTKKLAAKERRKAYWEVRKPWARPVHYIGVVLAVFLLVLCFRASLIRLLNSNSYVGMLAQKVDFKKMTFKELSDEEMEQIAPFDKRKAEKIDSLPDGDEDETWAVYMYVCGSNLESMGRSTLNEYARYISNTEGTAVFEESSRVRLERINEFTKELDENGMDLPDAIYEKEPLHSSNPAPAQYSDTISTDPGFASSNLEDIFKVKLPDNITFVIMTGGATNWDYPDMNANKSQVFVYNDKGLKEVESRRIQNMGDEKTLEEFLSYCKENYPADHTMLSMWDHGGATGGACYDELFAGDNLSLREMRDAVSNVYTFNPDYPELDIVSFDACLMATKEVCDTFYGYAHYLLASEEIEPGEGWDYETWVKAIADNPGTNEVKLGKILADSYIVRNLSSASMGISSPVTFSVTDISKAKELSNAYSMLCDAVLEDSIEDCTKLSLVGQAANSSVKYAMSSYDACNMVDLGVFMKNLLDDYPDEAQRVLDALDDIVLYSRSASYAKDSMGLSVYFPVTINSSNGLMHFIDYIYEVSEDDGVNALYYYKIAGFLNEKYQDYAESKGYGEAVPLNTRRILGDLNDRTFILGDDGHMSIDVSEEEASYIQNATVSVSKIEEYSTYLLGEDTYVGYEDGKLYSDYEGKWLTIEGEVFPCEVISMDDENIVYRSHVIYNSVMVDKDAYIILNYNVADKKYSFGGVQAIGDSEGADLIGRNQLTFSKGDTITPLFEETDFDTMETVDRKGKKITYKGGELQISDKMLPDGEYIMSFMIMDARGNVYPAGAVEFEVKLNHMTDVHSSERFRFVK